MKNPFTALFRARDKPQDSVSAAPTFYFGTSGSGKAERQRCSYLLLWHQRFRQGGQCPDSNPAFHSVRMRQGDLGNSGQPAAWCI